jgi:hypothetical protein
VKVKLYATEWYPVYVEDEHGSWYDVPDGLIETHRRNIAALLESNHLIHNYLRAVKRDENAYKPAAEVNRKRLERGRIRHFRRARP